MTLSVTYGNRFQLRQTASLFFFQPTRTTALQLLQIVSHNRKINTMIPRVEDLWAIYCQADRCWRSSNFKSCLHYCDKLSIALKDNDEAPGVELTKLKHMVWFLKIKCLSEDYFVDESLLLNEDDIEGEDQIRTFTAKTRPITSSRATTAQASSSRNQLDRWQRTSGRRIDSSRGLQRTGALTGRVPTRSDSRQSGRATSSYRPLTTSLTATQTAFSRSTRPLLRYSTSRYLSKPVFEYLYNAQRVNNRCPDFRQCLEYLNLVPSLHRGTGRNQDQSKRGQRTNSRRTSEAHLVALNDETLDDKRESGQFWCMSNAICYFNLKMYHLAENYFRSALEVDPNYLDPYLWLIKVYLRLNQPMRVLDTCQDGLRIVRSAILYNWKARVQSLMNQSYAAHMSLKESIQYNGTNIEALANVGYYSFYGDKLELAHKCFERIFQLSSSEAGLGSKGAGESLLTGNCSEAELLNNLALTNFYCGYYMKVIPLFQRAFLSSPSKKVTSTIWYNISFVALNVGSRQLAIECLRMALKNDSQNEDAVNNLGVLKYEHLVNDSLHYKNRQEYWFDTPTKPVNPTGTSDGLANQSDLRRYQALFDDAETYFCTPKYDELLDNEQDENFDESDGNNEISSRIGSPSMLFNMAVLKRRRGQLLASVKFCRLYQESDQNNHTIRGILTEISEFVSHDS